MDVLFAMAMLGIMAAALIVIGRGWPHSSQGGGYHAGRGYGAGEQGDGAVVSAVARTGPQVPEDDDVRWRWTGDGAPDEERGAPAADDGR